MKRLIAWIQTLDRYEITYWVGLGMLFAGLSLGVSIATALVVTGSILVMISFLNSLIVIWAAARPLK